MQRPNRFAERLDWVPPLPRWLHWLSLVVGIGWGYWLFRDPARSFFDTLLRGLSGGGGLLLVVSWVWYIGNLARGRRN